MVGDRPSVGTVRRGWFPSKHTTCKRQLPDTRPHQAIVTVPSSLLHLAAESMFPTSADCRRVVVPRYAWLVIVVPLSLLSPFLSSSLSHSYLSLSLFIYLSVHPYIRLYPSLIGAYFLERLYGRTRSRRTFLVFGQSRELAFFVSLARYGTFFYVVRRSFHARAGSSYRDSSLLSPRVRSLASGTPASPTEERAGHKSGTTPARDCNPTGYTVLNRAPYTYVCTRACTCVCRVQVYAFVVVRSSHRRGMVSRPSVMLLTDHFTRINEGGGRARAMKVLAAKGYDKLVVRQVA